VADGRLRVLEVGLTWPPETFLRRKLNGLVAAGIEVTVAASASRHDARKRLPGIRLVRLRAAGEPAALAVVRLARDLVALAAADRPALARLLRTTRSPRVLLHLAPVAREDADVVHFEWERTARWFLPYLDAIDRPFVMSCRGAGLNVYPHLGEDGLGDALPALFARAAAVHCVSEAMRRRALAFGADPATTRVIYSGVDPELFSPGERTESEELRVICVGKLDWQKGHEDAVEAIGLLAAEGLPVSLEIVGREPDRGNPLKPTVRPQLLFLVHELGLASRVHLLGKLSHVEVRDRMRAADVLLQPSVCDGLPNALLEAMACALPVVVTDRDGMPEAVTDGVEGFVRPARSPEALADALRTLHRDCALARRLGEAGRARVLADFTVEREREAWKRLYAGVVGARPVRTPAPASRPTASARPTLAGRRRPQPPRPRRR
jgi:colanic acid/amylovoran biosynthesis glycosyltransferase